MRRTTSESGSNSGCLGVLRDQVRREGCFLWQEKLHSIRPPGTLTTQLSKKGEEGILWALSGPTGSWRTRWRGLGSRGRKGVSCLSVSTLIRAGKGAGAATLGRTTCRGGGQQKASSRVWGAEAQGTQQLLLWHKGAEGTPFWRVSQAAGAGGWVDWRCSSARGPI